MAQQYLDKTGLAHLWGKIKAYVTGLIRQSDWNETDSTSLAYIANKPTIPPGGIVDETFSDSSINPVQNHVIKAALDGKVSKDGDTMTGNLLIEKTGSEAFMEFQRTDLNMRLGTTDANGSVGGFHYYDSNRDLVMYLESKLLTGDRTRAQLYARRTDASGQKYSHGFGILIDGQGNGSVEFSSTAFRDAWADGMNVVKKAGDTMMGNLVARFSGFDLSQSNNGVSATQYPTTYCILDNGGRISTRIEGVVSSSGTMAAYWYVRNYNTSGTQVGQKGIQMIMDKSGNLTYSISDSANFRSAIGAVNRAGDTLTANFTLSASDTSGRFWKVKNSKHEGSFYVDSAGNLGVWSDTKARWLIRCDTSGYVYVNGHNLTNGIKGWTNLGSTTGTTAKAISISGYTEILVVMNYGTSYWGSCFIPTGLLGTTAAEWYCGGGNKGSSSPSGRRGVFKATTTAITPVLVTVDGTDYSNSSVITRVYAR